MGHRSKRRGEKVGPKIAATSIPKYMKKSLSSLLLNYYMQKEVISVKVRNFFHIYQRLNMFRHGKQNLCIIPSEGVIFFKGLSLENILCCEDKKANSFKQLFFNSL